MDSERDDHGARMRQARKAVTDQQQTYRTIAAKKGEVDVLSRSLRDLRERNHFSELLADMLRDGSDHRLRGQ